MDKELNQEELVNKLNDIRFNKSLSIQKLADEADVDFQVMYRFLNGKKPSFVSVSKIYKYIKANG